MDFLIGIGILILITIGLFVLLVVMWFVIGLFKVMKSLFFKKKKVEEQRFISHAELMEALNNDERKPIYGNWDYLEENRFNNN